MQVTLPPELEARIQREIDRGVFDSPVDVISTALDALEATERDHAALRDLLALKLDESFAAADRGEFVTEAELDRTLKEWRSRLTR